MGLVFLFIGGSPIGEIGSHFFISHNTNVYNVSLFVVITWRELNPMHPLK